MKAINSNLVTHRIDDLETNGDGAIFICDVTHRIDDLENCDNQYSKLTLVTHRIDDLEI